MGRLNRIKRKEVERLTSTDGTLLPLNISDWAAMSAATSAAGMASSASNYENAKNEG